MVAVYLRLIKAGAMQVEDVPVFWQEQVREALEKEKQEEEERKAAQEKQKAEQEAQTKFDVSTMPMEQEIEKTDAAQTQQGTEDG